MQIPRNGKTIICLLDKIKCLINSTHDLEIFSQIKLGKINYFACKFQQFKGDCKCTWKQINCIRPNRINKKNLINKFVKMTLHM